MTAEIRRKRGICKQACYLYGLLDVLPEES